MTLNRRRALARFAALIALLGLFAIGRNASAAPEAHILRIDPRASNVDGAPILTTVVEVVQNKRMSDLLGECAVLSGNAALDCTSSKLEQPMALWSPFDFLEKNAFLTVLVDGTDVPAKFESKARWGDQINVPGSGVGTAWLLSVDASSSMGARFDEAKAVATAFVNSMTVNDIVDVQFFNDRGVVLDSHWVNNKAAAIGTINSAHTFPIQGRTRPLGDILQKAAIDGFKELGNAGMTVTVPMHQAMVVLSNGSSGADPGSAAAMAKLFRQALTKGRYPEDNEVLPRMPTPVVSIFFPAQQIEEFGANAREFMEGLANTEMGGFFTIVRDRQESKAPGIVNAVRTRFNKMWIVKWRVSCVAPTINQTFKLFFQATSPPIAGDTFQNVPVGIDPSTWPLDIDREATERNAKKDPIYPGGKVTIFGNFCWGGNDKRAEIYMIPKNQAAPATLQNGTLDDAKRAQKSLIEQGMKGKAIQVSDTSAQFETPDTEKFLVGSGEKMTARMIVYDNQARRTSAITQDKLISVAARTAPFPFLLVGGVTFGGVVIVLLMVSILRGGGGKRGRGGGGALPPRPIVAGGAPAPFSPGPAPFSPGPAPPPAGGFGGGGFGGDAFAAPPPGGATRATLSGAQGIFTVLPGVEMKAGRDGAMCQILLTEPRVSGQHATVKLEGGQLLVRDENSNNGTTVNGARIPGGTWTPVPPGATLKFGPVEFSVRLE